VLRPERLVFGILAAASAVSVAAFLAWFTHDLMGLPRSLIRADALIDAAIVGLAYAASFALKPSK
jgi:hypothetical protein